MGDYTLGSAQGLGQGRQVRYDGPTTAPPVERATVTTEIERQQNRLAGLWDNIQRLEVRLAAVLSPAPPSAVANTGSIDMSSLRGRLAAHTDGIGQMADTVASMLERLEL